jgi:hypothetical protein
MFAAALWLLLRDVIDTATEITIDAEYLGHEADIKAALLRMAWQRGRKIAAHTIVFSAIGKKSGAHKRAIGVYRSELRADRLITAGDLLDLLGK